MAWRTPYGGYDCDFVDHPSESLTCAICLMPFRNPHILDCCGAKYCESCIGRVKAASQPCPICKQFFNSMVDRSKHREVLSLKVRCSRKTDGCDWKGELRHLEEHEKGCTGAKRQSMDAVMDRLMRHVETKLTIERECHQREIAALRQELTKQMEQHKKECEAQLEQVKKEIRGII